MQRIEHGRDEDKRKLERFGNAREKGGERRRDHDAAHLLALLRARGAPDGHGGCGQAEHLEQVSAGHVAGRRIARNEACDLAMNHLTRCGIQVVSSLEEERDVPDMVQAERDEPALNHSVERERERRPLVHRPMRESCDGATNRWPYEAEYGARQDDGESGDDRYRAFAGEEAEITR